MADRYDWVEIVEPRTGDHMFANLKSGQCLWEPPEGANVKATSDNQWWELYDPNTRRYYYYNSATQKTVWRKPMDGDIIALAKLQLLKAKETKHSDKTSFKAKNKSRPREGSNGKGKQSRETVETKIRSQSDVVPSSLTDISYESSSLPKLKEADCHDYVNVSFDKDIIYDVSVIKSAGPRSGPENAAKESVSRTFSLADNNDTNDVEGRKTKWMSMRNSRDSQKDCSPPMPLFESTALPVPEEAATYTIPIGGGPKRAPPKPPRGSMSPAKSPRKFSMDSQLIEGKIESSPLATDATDPAPDAVENGLDNSHIYDEFDQHNSSEDSIESQNGLRKEAAHSKTIERPARPPPPAPSGSMTLPNPKRKMPEPYASAHTPVAYESGSLARNIKLALEKKDESYKILSTDEESNRGSLSPLSQLMADVQGYNFTENATNGSKEDLSKARSEKSNAEPTAPSGPSADDGRMHYVSMYDNVDDEIPSQSLGEDNVEGVSHSKAATASPPPPPPPPHVAAVYEIIPSEPSQLEVSVANHLPSIRAAPKSTGALVDACEGYYKSAAKGMGPKERKVLTRSKSDRVVTRTQQKSGKERSPGSSFRPTSMLPFRKPSLNKSQSMSINENQIKEAVPLNTHRKGLFRRRMSIASMLSWSKTPIRKPMVLTRDKHLRKDAVDVFKLILQYMGDKNSRKSTQSIGLDIVCRGWSTVGLRDEIYVQLCKQTTENTKEMSLQRGWELMCMCLAMFPTSNKFHSYLEGYIYRHLDPDSNDTEVPVEAYAKHCYKQLERICGTGAKRGNKKPTSEELEQAKNMVFNPSMFGNTLEDIMELQAERFPERRLPWIITTLSDVVRRCNALTTEGIFRVPGDIDEVNMLKVHVDKWKDVTKTFEPHVPASLLKLWFRDLHEPLIPQAFYDSCIHNCEDPTVALGIVYSLPELNHWVFAFLVRFLQSFMAPVVSKVTLMDENNLAMVWAPNCLRCPSDDPMEILESTRKEMAFLRTVMRNWDTSFLDGVL